MYAIYGNIYHQYTPNVSIYTSTMDPMGIHNQSPLATVSPAVSWWWNCRYEGSWRRNAIHGPGHYLGHDQREPPDQTPGCNNGCGPSQRGDL